MPGGQRSVEKRIGSARGETSEGRSLGALSRRNKRDCAEPAVIRQVGSQTQEAAPSAAGVAGTQGAGTAERAERHRTPRKRSCRSGQEKARLERDSEAEPRSERGCGRVFNSNPAASRRGKTLEPEETDGKRGSPNRIGRYPAGAKL
jgi:hypothetical protein